MTTGRNMGLSYIWGGLLSFKVGLNERIKNSLIVCARPGKDLCSDSSSLGHQSATSHDADCTLYSAALDAVCTHLFSYSEEYVACLPDSIAQDVCDRLAKQKKLTLSALQKFRGQCLFNITCPKGVEVTLLVTPLVSY